MAESGWNLMALEIWESFWCHTIIPRDLKSVFYIIRACRLSRADQHNNLFASGSPDLTPVVRRCSTLLAAGFFLEK
jgi:hypothetical protein